MAPALLLALALGAAADPRLARAARPPPPARDAGSRADPQPCAAVPVPELAARYAPAPEPPAWAPGGAEAAVDGGVPPRLCELSGRVTVLPRAGARPPSGVVVFLEGVPARDFARPEPRTYQIRQKNRQFVPRLMVIQRHDTVEFWNDDQEVHQVFSSDRAEAFDIPGTSRSKSGEHRFRDVGSVRLQCNIHPRMRSDLRVVDNPYSVVTQPDGTWQLVAPAGTWRLVAWEPNGGRAERPVSPCVDARVDLSVPQAEEPVPRKKGGPPAPEYSQ